MDFGLMITGRSRISKKMKILVIGGTRFFGIHMVKELLGCDVTTPEGVRFARENGLFKDFCPKMVASAVDVLESVIEEMRKNENSQHEGSTNQ